MSSGVFLIVPPTFQGRKIRRSGKIVNHSLQVNTVFVIIISKNFNKKKEYSSRVHCLSAVVQVLFSKPWSPIYAIFFLYEKKLKKLNYKFVNIERNPCRYEGLMRGESGAPYRIGCVSQRRFKTQYMRIIQGTIQYVNNFQATNHSRFIHSDRQNKKLDLVLFNVWLATRANFQLLRRTSALAKGLFALQVLEFLGKPQFSVLTL